MADALNKSMSPSPMNSAPIANVLPPKESKAPAPRRESAEPTKFEKELSKNDAPERSNAKLEKADAKADAKAADGKKADSAGQKQPSEAATRDAKTTQPLKRAATRQKAAVESAPAVAFLQGKFESLSPEQIPGILSDNEFISDALSEEDVLQFLSKPASIDDLIESLDLPDSLREEAEKLGLDVGQAISPTDFLASIGVDPQRVFNELNFLKANIHSETLIPSIQRAILGLKMPQGPMLSGEAAQAAGNGQQQQQQPLVAPPLGIPTQAGANGTALQQAQAQQAAGRAAPAAPGMAPPSVGAPQVNVAAPQIAAPQAPSLSAKSAAMASPSDIAQPFVENFVDVATAPQPFSTTAAAALTNPLAQSAAPKMAGASFDAFAAMGMRLDASGMDTRNLSPMPELTSDAAGAPSLEEALVTMQLHRPNAAVRPFAQPMGDMTDANLNLNNMAVPAMKADGGAVIATDVRPEAATPLVPHWDAGGAKMFDAAALMGGRNAFQDVAAPKTDVMANARPADELRLVMPNVLAEAVRPSREGSDAGKDQSSGFDRGHDGGLSDMTSSLVDFKPQAAASHATSFAAHVKPEAPGELSTAERAQLTQQIFERASMLQKEGGGIVKLELPTENLGSLEMAVSVEHDRVDLRVIAGSERAREVMSAELNQLRNALQVQNLQLGNVEVGVGGRNQQQSFQGFADQQHRREQFDIAEIKSLGRNAARGSVDALERMTAARRPLPTAFASGAAANPYNAVGRLEVRA